MEAMKGYGWTRFPPTYDQQWTMLDDVMSVGGAPPAAVFVDFVYSGQGGPNEGSRPSSAGVAAATNAQAWKDAPGCHVDPLIKIACIEAAGGTPMIFAKPSPADLDLFTDVQRRLDSVAVLAPALVVSRPIRLVTNYHFDAARRAGWACTASTSPRPWPCTPPGACGRADGCEIDAFRQLKARAKDALAGRLFARRDRDEPFDAPLDVVWGSRPDPALPGHDGGGHRPARALPGSRAGGWLARLGEQLGGPAGSGRGREAGVSICADAGV